MLLISTKNPSKIAEFADWLSRANIPFKTLNDFPDIADVEETGATFEENAKLKAKAYFDATGLPALADDGGIVIDALGGLPGVKSKRWIHGDRESSDEELVAHTLKMLEDVPDEKRTARFTSTIALYDGDNYVCEVGSVEGSIARQCAPYSKGAPYWGLLFIRQFGKMYGALSEEEHEAVNHRRIALEKLRGVLIEKYGKV